MRVLEQGSGVHDDCEEGGADVRVEGHDVSSTDEEKLWRSMRMEL